MRSVHRTSRLIAAAVLMVAVLLLPSLSAALPGPVARGAFGVHTEAGGCAVTVTVSTVLAFSISNNYCTTSHISMEMIETSSLGHTWTLSPISNFSFNPNNMTSDLETFFAAHRPIVNIVPNPTPRATNFTNFTTPGTVVLYEFVCMVPWHFQAGMWGFLGINITPPGGGGATTGPGAGVFIIAGTIAGLVVDAIVLGFVVGRRRGAEEEMPPERLGYPEPEAPLSSRGESTPTNDPTPGAKR